MTDTNDTTTTTETSSAATATPPPEVSGADPAPTPETPPEPKAEPKADAAPAPDNPDKPWLDGIADQALKTLLVKKGWHKEDSAEAALAKITGAYGALEKRVGFDPSKVIEKPKEGQSRADWLRENAEALGMPAEPSGYEITKPDLPKGAEWDEATEATVREKMHAAGATPEAVQAAVDLYAGMVAAQAEAAETEIANAQRDAMAKLTEEWGGQAAANIDLARRAAHQLMTEAGIEGAARDALLIGLKSGLGGDAAADAGMARLFHTMAKYVGEDAAPFPNHGAGSDGGSLTPAEARAEIEAMKARDHPYSVAVRKGDQKALKGFEKRRELLFAIAAQGGRK